MSICKSTECRKNIIPIKFGYELFHCQIFNLLQMTRFWDSHSFSMVGVKGLDSILLKHSLGARN